MIQLLWSHLPLTQRWRNDAKWISVKQKETFALVSCINCLHKKNRKFVAKVGSFRRRRMAHQMWNPRAVNMYVRVCAWHSATGEYLWSVAAVETQTAGAQAGACSDYWWKDSRMRNSRGSRLCIWEQSSVTKMFFLWNQTDCRCVTLFREPTGESGEKEFSKSVPLIA